MDLHNMNKWEDILLKRHVWCTRRGQSTSVVVQSSNWLNGLLIQLLWFTSQPFAGNIRSPWVSPARAWWFGKCLEHVHWNAQMPIVVSNWFTVLNQNIHQFQSALVNHGFWTNILLHNVVDPCPLILMIHPWTPRSSVHLSTPFTNHYGRSKFPEFLIALEDTQLPLSEGPNLGGVPGVAGLWQSRVVNDI